MGAIFSKESDFEDAVVAQLQRYGWTEVLTYVDEDDLVENWAQILFDNNNEPDILNNCPLSACEKTQLKQKISELRTPCALNEFINGGSFLLRRDNPDDQLHCGREVSLKIYSRTEIAAGKSRYQIVRQPRFESTLEHKDLMSTRRGDLLLLINGMPVIHIELKRSGVPVSQACNQIMRYSSESMFRNNIFALIQVFVAMTPEKTLYFANPGPDVDFRPEFFFQWADFNNEPITAWDDVIKSLLSIPMAHTLIGFYTVADKSTQTLKVMRSYQYYAADAIAKVVRETFPKLRHEEVDHPQHGGYIWHTTGSGKTMTSFKSAQLIAASGDADKVIFLVDRIALGTQSLAEYQHFALDNETVHGTEHTGQLVRLLLSSDRDDSLIVTSIQKLSRLRLPVDDGDEHGLNGQQDQQGQQGRSSFADGIGSFELNEKQARAILEKRIVIIVDECHRSTFGQMNYQIRRTFPQAIFFGFTGTPIHDENKKRDLTTASLFGNELHRYSIADGIRDHNVLGFDPYRVSIFRPEDLREKVALDQAQAQDRSEALADPQKKRLYQYYLDRDKVPNAGYYDEVGYVKGIEDFLPLSQYRTPEYQHAVVSDILREFPRLSAEHKFHAIFATSSISEALEYYQLFREHRAELKVTCLFDASIDNDDAEQSIDKEQGLVQLLQDYNQRFETTFTVPEFPAFKRDVAARLAHKKPHIYVTPEQQLDLLIVVDQMLTGFDSVWVNTLYLDKVLTYESVIQAFSRTNRIFGPDKPFGIIKYYRQPFTMERNINEAVKLYSGDKPLGLLVPKVEEHACRAQKFFHKIKELFAAANQSSQGTKQDKKNTASTSDTADTADNAGAGAGTAVLGVDWSHLPEDKEKCAQFVKLFNGLNRNLQAAQIQGLKWEQLPKVSTEDGERLPPQDEQGISAAQGTGDRATDSELFLGERVFVFLLQRYKELARKVDENERQKRPDDVPYDLESHIISIDTGKIDTDYMNSRFAKFYKRLLDKAEESQIAEARQELHQSFAYLSKEEQKAAYLFLSDIESGDVQCDPDKTFSDYITEYMQRDYDDNVHDFAEKLGLDEPKLRALLKLRLEPKRIDGDPLFKELKSNCNWGQAKVFLEQYEGRTLIPPKPKVTALIHKYLREFLLSDGDLRLEAQDKS